VLEQNCWNSSNSRIDDDVLIVLSCESWRHPDDPRSPLRCLHSRFFIRAARAEMLSSPGRAYRAPDGQRGWHGRQRQRSSTYRIDIAETNNDCSG